VVRAGTRTAAERSAFHPPASPAASVGSPQGTPGAFPSPGGSTPSFSFDIKRWTKVEKITGVATLLLFISLFLPWFTYNIGFGYGSVSVDGLGHGWMYLVLLVCLGILGYLVVRAGFGEMPFKLPMPVSSCC